MVVDSFCSVPLPVPFSEQQILENISIVDPLRRPSVTAISPIAQSHPFPESRPGSSGLIRLSPSNFGLPDANSGAYFTAVAQLCVISQSILTALYSAGTMVRSPSDLQRDIVQIGQRMDDWVANLPGNFNFQIPFEKVTTPDNSTFRQRTILAFQLCSAKMLLTRPCLNGLGKSDREHKEGPSANFLRRMAIACVEAAKTEVDLLPDQPQPHFTYEFGPWWMIVHHLMQALAVLLLALSCSSTVHQNNEVLAGYCNKIIRWLRAMEDPQAERAHQVAMSCYDIVAVRLSLPSARMAGPPGLLSGVGQDNAAQAAALSAYQLPTTTGLGYPPEFAMPVYSGTVGDSAPFHYAPDGLYDPQHNQSAYDGAYHQ